MVDFGPGRRQPILGLRGGADRRRGLRRSGRFQAPTRENNFPGDYRIGVVVRAKVGRMEPDLVLSYRGDI